jgi:hypothetical protein
LNDEARAEFSKKASTGFFTGAIPSQDGPKISGQVIPEPDAYVSIAVITEQNLQKLKQANTTPYLSQLGDASVFD